MIEDEGEIVPLIFRVVASRGSSEVCTHPAPLTERVTPTRYAIYAVIGAMVVVVVDVVEVVLEVVVEVVVEDVVVVDATGVVVDVATVEVDAGATEASVTQSSVAAEAERDPSDRAARGIAIASMIRTRCWRGARRITMPVAMTSRAAAAKEMLVPVEGKVQFAVESIVKR